MSIISKGSNVLTNEVRVVADGRFSRAVQQTARALNRLAIQETKSGSFQYTFSKATPEDLKRLTSRSIKDSYKRATWTNPKDNKVYHILEESRKGGKIQVRILDKDGAFVKNAELTPQNIVIFDTFLSFRGVSHGDMMKTFLRRTNPFANVECVNHKNLLDFCVDSCKEFMRNGNLRGSYRKGRDLTMDLEVKRFEELAKQIEKGKKVDYISMSEYHFADVTSVMHKGQEKQLELVSQSSYISSIRPIFERILASGTRILESAGNELNHAQRAVSDELSIKGVEGVGSLYKGKVAGDSASRNSVFTQHYERRNHKPRIVRDKKGKVLGINVTGLLGTDMPLNWRSKKLLSNIYGGTSNATAVRVGKLSLTDMMEGIV